jgi:predicted secreted protein
MPRYPFTLSWKETLASGVCHGLEVDKSMGVFDDERTGGVIAKMLQDRSIRNIKMVANTNA